MLKNKKILLASAVLATISVMNVAYAADMKCTTLTAKQITDFTVDEADPTNPSNSDIASCGRAVEKDIEKAAAVAVLISKSKRLSKKSIEVMADEESTNAGLAAEAFTKILSDSSIDITLRETVANAAAKVVLDNPEVLVDKTTGKDISGKIVKALMADIVLIKSDAFDGEKAKALKVIIDSKEFEEAVEKKNAELSADPVNRFVNQLSKLSLGYKIEKGEKDYGNLNQKLKDNPRELIKLAEETHDKRDIENTCSKPILFGFFPIGACSPAPKPK